MTRTEKKHTIRLMDIIEKSLQIALAAYSGQKDKAGETYILHPLRVMGKMETKEAKAAAILHDVIEDSEYTAENLTEEGIPGVVVDAVVSLTKKDGETYSDFIKRVSLNELATMVKIADIEDNINILRLAEISSKDLERLVKYHKAHKMLKNSV